MQNEETAFRVSAERTHLRYVKDYRSVSQASWNVVYDPLVKRMEFRHVQESRKAETVTNILEVL